MANIADNLKRLLGTEGHNIQEVLENTDSIGGGLGSIPLIEFVRDSSDQAKFSVGEVRGIDDVTKYYGLCIIKVTNPQDGAKYTFFGNAIITSVSFDPDTQEPHYGTTYGYAAFQPDTIFCTCTVVAFCVSEDEIVSYTTVFQPS